jgi:hypothetical protein
MRPARWKSQDQLLLVMLYFIIREQVVYFKNGACAIKQYRYYCVRAKNKGWRCDRQVEGFPTDGRIYF